MRRMDLTPYPVVVGIGNDKRAEPYDVRFSLRVLLLHPHLELNATGLLKNQDLVDKLAKAESPVLLEDAEWNQIVQAVDKIRGFSGNDVELMRRIKNAPEVKVAEVKPEAEKPK